MIKDMVIRPLVVATEKVVEYYFPEEKVEAGHQATTSIKSLKHIKKLGAALNRLSAGSTTKTTVDDATFLSEQDSSDLSKLKKRMKKLDLSSLDENMAEASKLTSPKSHKTLKKRRFRQLERHNIADDLFSSESSSQKGG